MIAYLITSIVAESAGKTFDKLNYKRTKISPRQALLLTFGIMTFSVVAYILVTRQPLPSFTPHMAVLLSGIALLSFAGNVLDEVSLKKTDLSLREPLINFEPILAGLIAYLLFPGEREPIFLVAFILGAIVVNWGINQRTLSQTDKRGLAYLLVAVILYASIPVFYKEALEHWSPTYIALFRLSSVLVLALLFFRPKRHHKLTPTMLSYGTAAGLFYAIGAVVSLYAIQTYGVVQTMVFLMLGPALRYLASQFILHENVRRGQVLSSLMLAVIVAVAAFAK